MANQNSFFFGNARAEESSAVTAQGAGAGLGNNYLTGLSFNTSNGNLTAQMLGLPDIVTNLDGRYRTTAQTLSFTLGELTITDGNTVDLDSRYYTESEVDSLVNGVATYAGWTISDGSNSELIGSSDTLTITGTGTVTSSYDAISNTLTLFGTSPDLSNYAVKNADNNFSADQTFATNVTVTGNLTVNGTQFITNTETVEIEDNLLIINNGEVGTGITAALAGIEVDRGLATNYQFVFEESSDLFKIGTAGSLQAVATRPDNPTAGHFAKWSAGNSLEFVSESSITAGNATALAGYGITRFMLLDNSPVPTFANGDVPVYQSADGFFGSLTLATVARTNSYNDLDNKPSFTETDTLQSVTNRAATTTKAITVGGLTSNGNGTFTGNVGIGTTSPENKVHIQGSVDGDFNGLLVANTKAYGVGTGTNETATISLAIKESGNAVDRIFAQFTAGPNSETSSSNGIAHIKTRTGAALTEKMTFLSNGNVGIGTTSPNYPFHVYHPTYNIVGLLESGDTTCGLDLKDSVATGRITNTSGKLSIQADLNAEGADSNINFRVDNVERMRISSSGNVGIGTTSPSAKLQVYDNRDITSNPEDKGIRLLESHGDWLLSLGVSNVTSTGFAIRDNVTNTYPFVIRETTGRVGIGTTNPGSLLEMAGTNPILSIKDSNGSGSAAAPYMQFKDSDGLRLGYFGYGATSNDHLYIQNDRSSGHILFRTNSTTRWEITEFGTLLGYYNLTTSGTITANGGDSDDWNTAYDYSVNFTGSVFNSANGNIEFFTRGQGTQTINLDGRYVQASNDFLSLSETSPQTMSGDLEISKSLPVLILNSPSSGNIWTEQGARVSIGESATTASSGGSGALHFTYTGDGRGRIGMGNITNGVPNYSNITFRYNANNIGYGGDYNTSYNHYFTGTANFTGDISGNFIGTFNGASVIDFARLDVANNFEGNMSFDLGGSEKVISGNVRVDINGSGTFDGNVVSGGNLLASSGYLKTDAPTGNSGTVIDGGVASPTAENIKFGSVHTISTSTYGWSGRVAVIEIDGKSYSFMTADDDTPFT